MALPRPRAAYVSTELRLTNNATAFYGSAIVIG